MGLITFIKETKGELKHVSWPTKNQTVNYTILVVVLSLVVAGIVFLLDEIFTGAISNFV